MDQKEQNKIDRAENYPILEKLKGRKEGFEVPLRYFESLSDEMLAQINKPKSTKYEGVVTKLFNQMANLFHPQPVLKLASVLMIIGSISLFFYFKIEQGQIADRGNIPTDALQSYVLSNLEEFDMEILTEMFEESPGSIPDLSLEALEGINLNGAIEEIIEEIPIEDIEELL